MSYALSAYVIGYVIRYVICKVVGYVICYIVGYTITRYTIYDKRYMLDGMVRYTINNLRYDTWYTIWYTNIRYTITIYDIEIQYSICDIRYMIRVRYRYTIHVSDEKQYYIHKRYTTIYDFISNIVYRISFIVIVYRIFVYRIEYRVCIVYRLSDMVYRISYGVYRISYIL